MGKARTVRKDEDLQAAARHVNYEVKMLFYSASRIGGWHASPPEPAVSEEQHMALESFLLHYRNLRGFLCPNHQRLEDTDIIGSDFTKQPDAQDLGDWDKLRVDKDRIDEMLSHLTYLRDEHISKGNYRWEVEEMLVSMKGELKVFFDALPNSARAWFPCSSLCE
jgi:hypothetical protein